MDCWNKETTERPSFQQLHETLNKLRDYEADKEISQNLMLGHLNQAYQEDGMERLCFTYKPFSFRSLLWFIRLY